MHVHPFHARPFHDREHAGCVLAKLLRSYASERPLIIGLPRGGVPVAYEVAKALRAELDVWIVRKLGAPMQPELGMGAVAEGGEPYIDEGLVERLGVSREYVEALVRLKSDEVRARQMLFREGAPPPDVRGRTVIVVDDGIATGGTARAALRAIRRGAPAKIVLAVPIASRQRLETFADEADEIVCAEQGLMIFAVGEGYEDFEQTSDEEVVRLLRAARAWL